MGFKNEGLNNKAIVIAYIPSIVYHLKILKGKHEEIMKAILAARLKPPKTLVNAWHCGICSIMPASSESESVGVVYWSCVFRMDFSEQLNWFRLA